MGKYDDIIEMEHHRSKKHPPMPYTDRAAQFAPFAALTGHGEMMKETARLTDARIELDDNRKEELDIVLQKIREELRGLEKERQHQYEFTFFEADSRKTGGSYQKIRGRVKTMDSYRGVLVFDTGEEILIDNLWEIDEIDETEAEK